MNQVAVVDPILGEILDPGFPEFAADFQDEIPEPVLAADEEEPPPKKAKLVGNFNLTCVGADVSDDSSVATTYYFKISLNNNETQKNRASVVYDVDIAADEFHIAQKRWTKVIKTGLLVCPGGTNGFIESIQKAVLEYEERDAADDDMDAEQQQKPKLKLDGEDVVKIGEQFYLISGKRKVFLFTPTEIPYVKKLSDEEIDNLPVKILFSGKEKDYTVDPKTALTKLLKLIRLHDRIRKPSDQSSFVYGILQNYKCELYRIVEDHRICGIYSNTTNSGKSVDLLMGSIMCTGNTELISGCTESGLRGSLEDRAVARFDELDATDAPAATKMLKAIWQLNGGIILMANKKVKVSSTFMFSTNLTPKELTKAWKLTQADLTKFDLNCVGESPMEHVCLQFQEVLNECVALSKELLEHKVVLYGTAFSVLNKRPTGTDIAPFDDMVGTRSQRFAQGLYHLEQFSHRLVNFAKEYGFDDAEIPNCLKEPDFSCILRGKDIVARQSDKRPRDLISELMRVPEVARDCLSVTSKGRVGIAIQRAKLKQSALFKDWMLSVMSKLDEFDSTVGGERIRGRLIPKEEIPDLFSQVCEMLTVTVEKSVIMMVKEDSKKKRRVLENLRHDIYKFCRNIDDDIEESSGDENDMEDGASSETSSGDKEKEKSKGLEECFVFEGGVYSCKKCKKKYKAKNWAVSHMNTKHIKK